MTNTLLGLSFLGLAVAVIIIAVFFRGENLMVGRVYERIPSTKVKTIKAMPIKSLQQRGPNLIDDIKENVIGDVPLYALTQHLPYSNMPMFVSGEGSIRGNWSKRREPFKGEIAEIPFHRDPDKMTKT